MADQQEALYAVVELFGHAKIAGAVSEQTFGGATLVRVDVPEVLSVETDYSGKRGEDGYPKRQRTITAHTRSFGPGAIYSINWCDKQTALLAAHSILHEPMKPYSVREALQNLPAEHLNRLLPLEMDGDRDDEIPY